MQASADQMLNVPLTSSSSTARARTVLPSDTSTLGSSHERRTTQHSSASGSTRSTSSGTRERLRQTELERDDLRRAILKERTRASEMERLAKEKQAVAERVKREGNSTALDISAIDAKFRMLELERETRAAKAEKRAPAKGMFKAACSTDLLFLIDTTMSMYHYINAAKQQVLDIVNDIENTFLNDVDVRIAVVSYKDHRDYNSIEAINFTNSVKEVRSFIGKLTASGGSDTPEDVLGGLQTALRLSWHHQTRCIVHIADAPAHGRTLNTCIDDQYPNPGSEPHGLTYEPLIKQMISLNINYAFLRITNQTDLMTYSFLKLYTAESADGELDPKNKYFNEARNRVTPDSRASSITAKGGLNFAEMMLGTTYSELRRLVVSTVTSSASRTAVRVSSIRSSNAWNSKSPKTRLSALAEDETDTKVMLDTSSPQWHTSGWLDEKLKVEGFSPNVVVHGAGSLDDKMASDNNITLSVSELTISKRSLPFAQGAMRVAFYARTAASDQRYVVKSFKRSGKRLPHLVEDMRSQALCKAFALEFNALSEEEQSIDFITTSCFKGQSRADCLDDDCLSLEPFIQGTYVKYNSNSGWVNKVVSRDRFSQIAQAFSHFTFERSQGRFLVCDLQGVGCILTDPAIHTLDPERFKLTSSNHNEEGFKLFFVSHVCNDICDKLRLRSRASMLRPGGILTFREDWPLMDRTTCCFNKLCARIIPVCTAQRSDEFPGYDWCTLCWGQIKSSRKKWLCVAEGEDDHEFDVSLFFWESQGRRAPRKCPRHRADEHLDRVFREDMGWRSTVSSSSVPLARMPTPPPYIPPSTPSLRSVSPTYTPLSPSATVRNSSSLWAKIKSPRKVKRSSSRSFLGP
jgi:hypothetical protein